jgi:hypothetical protein
MNSGDKQRIIELLEYMIACIVASSEDSLVRFEIEKMYEMLNQIKNSR